MADLLRDRYEPIEVVGHGGEARVLKALDRQHDRVVALKVRPVRDQHDRDSLLAEARILLAIPPHPNLPLVREDFFEGDQYVIAMDWIEGTDLAKLVRARGHPGLAPSSVFRWLADAASALTHLHTLERPVVHGDVKAANLVLTSGGRVVLVDFGLSSAPDSPRRRAGTVGYAAPELTAGGPPTRASDVYSLAATAFELLVGEPPTGIRPLWQGFDADQAAALEAAVRAGLATDPRKRVATPGELVERLRAGWGATLPTGVLTFCLTDIEGSTAHWSREPAAMARALVRHDELVADVVERRGGRFLKSMGEGDATVSAFPAASEAVRAMIELQSRLANDVLAPDELRLRVRAALHTGEAEQRDGDYFGPTLNVAARVRGLAAGGEVYLSAATAVLVGEHLPPSASLVELGPHRLRGVPEPEMVFALSAPGVVAPPPATVCPYPGLPAFEIDDAARFFGRDTVVSDLVARLRTGGFVALVGASGSGKSSVLRAGVAAQWGQLPVTVLTPGPEPDRLVDGDGLIIVDQLEEVFTLCTDPDRQTRFLDSLTARRGPVAVGIRADFYGRCAEHAGFAQAVAQHHVLLGPMDDDGLRQAICGPAAAAGLQIEPALVDVLVGEVAGEPGALPLLSHALRATWQHRDGRTLTLEAYRETGGLRSAIAATAEQVYESLAPDARALTRRTFLALTQPGDAADDSRRRATLAELTPASGSAGLAPLLEGMAAARLLIVGDDVVEVAHEALIREWPRLRAWLDEDREGLRLHRHLAAAAAAWDGLRRDPAELYRGPRLTAAEEWAAQSDSLSGIETEFLDASREERTLAERARARTTRRLRSMLAGVVVALVVALVGATVAVSQQRQASRARDRADVARISAVSRSVVDRQPDLGLLLAVIAHDLDDTADARGTLLNALETHPLLERLVYGVDSQLEAAVLSPDGRLLVTPTSDDTGTILWDTSTGKQTATLKHKNDFSLSAAISPNGQWLAVPTIYEAADHLPAGRLEVWDLRTRNLHAVVESPAGALMTADFTADGSQLFTQGGPSNRDEPPNVVVIWDTTTWQPLGDPWVLTPNYSGDETLAVSRDGSLVALRLPDDDARVGVWRVSDRSRVGSPIFVGEFAGRDIGHATALAFAPDGQTLAIATDGGPIFFVDPVTGAARRSPLELSESAATTMEFSADGATFALGRLDGRTQLYDMRTGEPLGPPLAASAAGTVDVSFSADGSRLVTTGSDRIGALWRLDGHRSIGTPLAGQDAPVTEAQFTPDGNQVVTAALDGKVTVRDAAGRIERSLTVPGEALSVDVDPSGGRLAAGGTGGGVVLVDLDGGNRVDVAVEDAWVHQVAFSPDGKKVALAIDNTAGGPGGAGAGELRFVDARTGTASGRSITHDESLVGVAFAPDGKTVAAIAQNNLLHIFAVPSGRSLGQPIEAVDSPITSVAYTPDGRRVILGIASGVVRTYDATTHKPVGAEFDADAAGIYGVATSPDGTLVAGTSLGWSTTRLWATATGTPLGGRLTGGRVPYTYHGFNVEHFMAARPGFSPDGRHLVTPGFAGAAAIWDLDATHWRQAACAIAGRDLTTDEWERYLPGRTPQRVCPN